VAGTGLAILGFSYLWLWASVVAGMPRFAHVALLVVGVVVLDIGAQMTQVANQTRIFGLMPSARSRLNTVYMVLYFSGAAVGSWLSSLAWSRWGWNGVCALALAFLSLAGLRHTTGVKAEVRGEQRNEAEPAAKTFLEA
jgi:predicted MFS family arabinose efflux permease